MAGAYFLYNDQLDPSTAITCTTQNGGTSTPVATLPLINTLDRRVAKVARITRAGMNGASLTKLRYKVLSASTGRGPLMAFVSNIVAANGATPSVGLQLFDASLNLLSSIPLVQAKPAASGLYNVMNSQLSYAAQPPGSTYWLDVLINFPGAQPAYVDVGRVWCSDAILLGAGVDTDWGIGAVDNAKVDRSRGQQIYAETVPRFRSASVRCSSIEEVYIYGGTQPTFLGMALEAGTSGEAAIFPRTSNTTDMTYLGIYGRLTRGPAIRHVNGIYYNVDLDIEEGL